MSENSATDPAEGQTETSDQAKTAVPAEITDPADAPAARVEPPAPEAPALPESAQAPAVDPLMAATAQAVAKAADGFSMRVVSSTVREDFAAHLRSALGLADDDQAVVCDETTAPDDKVQRGYIAASVTIDGGAYSASIGTP